MALILAVCAALAYGAAWVVPRLRAPEPRIEFASSLLDLGVAQPGSEVRGEMSVRNGTGEPFKFTITRSCNCTSIEPAAGEIEAGGTQVFRVSLKLGETHGAVSSAHIDVKDLTSGVIAASCRVAGRSVAPLQPTSSGIDFGEVEPGALGNASQEIEVAIDAKASCESADLTMALRLGKDFDFSFEPVDKRKARLTVRPRAGLNLGDHFDCIEISCPTVDYVLVIALHVHVSSMLVAAPSTVTMSAIGSDFESPEILVRNRRGSAVAALELTSPHESIDVVNIDAASNNVRRARIRMRGNGTVPPAETIHVRPQGSSDEVPIKLLFPTRAKD